DEARLDWAGFFAFSPEEGTYAVGLDGMVSDGLVAERLLELSDLQDRITAERRAELIGRRVDVLVDSVGAARGHREAPELVGIVALDGWVARRQGSTSSGAFLDQLADKVLVLGALIALVAEGAFWWVPVALIAVREVVISAYRSYVGRRGISVPARRWAKIK